MSEMLAIGCNIAEDNPCALVVRGLEGTARYEFSTPEDAKKADSALTRGMSAVYLAMLLDAAGLANAGTPVAGKQCANCGTSHELCEEENKKLLEFCGNWTKKEGAER